MRSSTLQIAAGLIISVLVAGSALADQSSNQAPYRLGDDPQIPRGIIGISLQVGADRIGDPAVLYVGMVHPQGPAHQAGLRHGDEIVTVDGTAVTGKSYEQAIHMIRGEAGTVVKLGVRAENGLRELSITRVAGDKLKRPEGSHGKPE